MVEYITRIEKHKYPIYKAERTIDNKKVVVTCNPEDKSVDIQFYRDNELLTKSTDFIDFEKFQLEFAELTFKYIFREQCTEQCTEQTTEIIAEICKGFLKYIKDTTINYINITGNITI